MNTFYLAWQDPEERRWFPVGRLKRRGPAPPATGDGVPARPGGDVTFAFTYTRGALKARQAGGFSPLPAFPDLRACYTSPELFPLFANRMLSTKRPEYERFVEWTSVPQSENDPLALLARSGGERATDMLEVFPKPQENADGAYCIHFFAHGLRYGPPPAMKRADALKPGEPLLMMADFQNPKDRHAIALRTAEKSPRDKHLMGYLPRYLTGDVRRLLLDEDAEATAPHVEVERVNAPPAPVHFRLLCRLEMQWAADFEPFDTDTYQPLETEHTAHV